MQKDLTGGDSDRSGRAALERLLAIAATDTGQSRCVANFLLAWHNARACGGFDLTELWVVSDPIRADMLEVIGLIARDQQHAAAYGHEEAFAALVRRRRPQACPQPSPLRQGMFLLGPPAWAIGPNFVFPSTAESPSGLR